METHRGRTSSSDPSRRPAMPRPRRPPRSRRRCPTRASPVPVHASRPTRPDPLLIPPATRPVAGLPVLQRGVDGGDVGSCPGSADGLAAATGSAPALVPGCAGAGADGPGRGRDSRAEPGRFGSSAAGNGPPAPGSRRAPVPRPVPGRSTARSHAGQPRRSRPAVPPRRPRLLARLDRRAARAAVGAWPGPRAGRTRSSRPSPTPRRPTRSRSCPASPRPSASVAARSSVVPERLKSCDTCCTEPLVACDRTPSGDDPPVGVTATERRRPPSSSPPGRRSRLKVRFMAASRPAVLT